MMTCAHPRFFRPLFFMGVIEGGERKKTGQSATSSSGKEATKEQEKTEVPGGARMSPTLKAFHLFFLAVLFLAFKKREENLQVFQDTREAVTEFLLCYCFFTLKRL